MRGYEPVIISAAELRNPLLGQPWDPRRHGKLPKLRGRLPRRLKKRLDSKRLLRRLMVARQRTLNRSILKMGREMFTEKFMEHLTWMGREGHP